MPQEIERYAVYPSLRDRVVVVTGGATGIGASIVAAFAAQGSRVAFLDLAEAAGHALAQQLAGVGMHPPLFLPCDLTDIEAVRSAMREIGDRIGAPLVLINNAASDDRHAFEDVTPEYWDGRMAVNLRHQFFAAQAVAPGMKAAGTGSIINLSSIAWIIPTPNVTAYVTAKAAIVGLTRALAQELGAWNIRVNCILPGAILTEKQRTQWMTPEYTAEVLGSQFLKRHLAPDEVARLALFLASDDSAGITSQKHILDAGWVLG